MHEEIEKGSNKRKHTADGSDVEAAVVAYVKSVLTEGKRILYSSAEDSMLTRCRARPHHQAQHGEGRDPPAQDAHGEPDP